MEPNKKQSEAFVITATSKKNGYLYIAHGQEYVDEAIKSLESIRAIEPDCHATIVTDSNSTGPFNCVINRPNLGGYLSKVEYMAITPYERTIFLDTDTYICGECKGVFEMLDYFDICMAPAPAEVELRNFEHPFDQIAGCVPFNTGVILYSKNKVGSFLEAISRCYADADDKFYEGHPNKKKSEQLCFQHALMHSDCRFFGLPSNWNMRTDYFVDFSGEVRIIHGRRGVVLEDIAKDINKTMLNRCWNPITRRIMVAPPFPKLDRVRNRLIGVDRSILSTVHTIQPWLLKRSKSDGLAKILQYIEACDNTSKAAKMLNLHHLLRRCCVVDGDVVELGSKTGETAVVMEMSTDKRLHVFDSFERGFPDLQSEDEGAVKWFNPDDLRRNGVFSETKEELISNFIRYKLPLPVIHDGWFSDTLEELPSEISFAYLDSDLYSSTLESLVAVYPRLSKGAIVLIDDYNHLFPGVQKAVEEFMVGKEEVTSIPAGMEYQAFFIRS